jgi:hypothetical protein
VPKTAPLAPCRPRDREPLFLGLCPTHPLSHHFCRPKISQAQNGFPRLTRPVFRRRLPMQHIAWTASTTPTSCSPLPLQHANRPHNFLTKPSLNYLSPPKTSQFGQVLVSAKLHLCWSCRPWRLYPPSSLARGSPVHMDPQRRLSVLISIKNGIRHKKNC